MQRILNKYGVCLLTIVIISHCYTSTTTTNLTYFPNSSKFVIIIQKYHLFIRNIIANGNKLTIFEITVNNIISAVNSDFCWTIYINILYLWQIVTPCIQLLGRHSFTAK